MSGNNGVTSAKLSIILPLDGVDVEEIRVGNEKISGFSAEFSKLESVYIKDGSVFMAYHPLSVDEVASFDEFIKKEERTQISDRFITTNHSRQTFIRAVEVKSEEMKLSCEYSPASEGIKNIACNDFPIEFPKLYATGFDIKTLPFIEG